MEEQIVEVKLCLQGSTIPLRTYKKLGKAVTMAIGVLYSGPIELRVKLDTAGTIQEKVITHEDLICAKNLAINYLNEKLWK